VAVANALVSFAMPRNADTCPLPASPHVIGVVLTVSDSLSAAQVAVLLAALRACPGLRLGEPRGPYLPVSAETSDPRALHCWLEALPGVRAVDVTFVEIADSDGATTPDVAPRRDPDGDFIESPTAAGPAAC
jgi:hypothetical protein